jgi:hypothetical protein
MLEGIRFALFRAKNICRVASFEFNGTRIWIASGFVANVRRLILLCEGRV